MKSVEKQESIIFVGWERVEMNYVAIQNINYHEDFRLVLGEGQCKWGYGLVIRGRQKYIHEASDTFWAAVVAIIYGRLNTQGKS